MERSHGLTRCLSLIATLVAISAPSRAQCLNWNPDFGLSGMSNRVRGLAVFDEACAQLGAKLFVQILVEGHFEQVALGVEGAAGRINLGDDGREGSRRLVLAGNCLEEAHDRPIHAVGQIGDAATDGHVINERPRIVVDVEI